MEGKFTVQKTNREFSKIALEHNYEQLNGKIIGVGGKTGLTENDNSLQGHPVSGPETAYLFDKFKYSIGLYELENDVQEYHDSNEAFQIKFFNDVLQLKKAFEEFGNPFLYNSLDLHLFEQICRGQYFNTLKDNCLV